MNRIGTSGASRNSEERRSESMAPGDAGAHRKRPLVDAWIGVPLLLMQALWVGVLLFIAWKIVTLP
jgi:hypothetical protein